MKKIKILILLLLLFISVSAVSAEGNFTALQNEIYSSTDTMEITQDYVYDNATDYEVNRGIIINKTDFAINGNGYTIDASNQTRIFNIFGNNITISNLNFINGNINELGGAIVTHSSVTLNNVTFSRNHAMDGGAIYSFGQLTINNGVFTNNWAHDGGAISSPNETTINNAVFTNNWAEDLGIIYSDIITINNATFSGNNATWGGGVFSITNAIIANSTFANSTSSYAAAIYAQENMTISKCIFENLHANETAGAIGAKELIFAKISDCIFTNITANKNGGAIYIDYSLSNEPEGTVIEDSKFIDSRGDYGGALVQLMGNLTILNSYFTNNSALYDGGAIFTSHTESHIENCSFESNKLSLEDMFNGGAIYCDYGKFTFKSSDFINNIKNAIYLYDGTLNVSGCEFENNGEAIYCVFGRNIILNDNEYNDDILVLNDTNYGSVLSGNGIELELVNNTINVEKLPARYDLRDWGWVSSVKNQGPMGACWTFGSCGALESALLKATGIEYDFSENNMQDNMLKYSKYGAIDSEEGGWQEWALAYILSWFGPFPTEYDTYDQLGKLSPLIITDENIHVQDAILLKQRKNFTDNDAYKKALIKYGSLHITYNPLTEEPYYNRNTSAQYQNISTEQGHAVSLVGWDDNYPASNFLMTPPGDGAWIIKNSWGTDWGEGGYGYISYYDTSIFGYNYMVGFIIENTENYTTNYQTDLGGSLFIQEYDVNASYKITYSSFRNELISAVGTYFADEGEEYLLEIYVNDELKHSQTGTAPYRGFHTVKLTKEIPIRYGDNFTAVMTKENIPIINESRQHYEENRIFINTGSGWTDISQENKTVSLKVYTKDLAIYTEDLVKIYKNDSQFEANIDGINKTVVFEINGGKYTRTTNENGTARMAINLNPGNYTIKTTYKNVTVENSIEVLPTLYAKDLVKYYRNDTHFLISLIDGAGNPVSGVNITMNINGVFYNRTTNENGTAKMNIWLNPGEYILTAIDPLTGLMMSYNITVLTVLNASDMNMTYLDGSQFKAGVLDGEGKPLANAAVTFNINGIFYTRYTDSEGIAKLNIKLMAGEYIITSEYEWLRISNTITIKD